MLDHYHLLINTLNEAETALLDDHSQELLRVFRSGYKRLNWNSLGNNSSGSPYGYFFWGVCVWGVCACKCAHTWGISKCKSTHANTCTQVCKHTRTWA
jgi:hypothetical protein